ncbi:MAG: hypothetical protein JF604_08685, partial [Bradyrhizobium sp.]|nr:hypothetical protein [Bradyrhizobium sp.]
SAADLGIGLTVNSIHQMYFKTDPNGAVPGSSYDALSIFLHEIAHGLGFFYGSDDPSFPGVAIFDTFVQNGGFTGPNAEAAYSGFSQPVPLDPLSLSHLSGSALTDLMASSISPGVNMGISLIDLGILQDIGVPLNLPTSGDDIIHDVVGRYGVYLNLMLGAGNDTGYALPTGGSRIFGEDGNDLLVGDKGGDYLDGGNGNDIFYGGGKNDIIFGANDLDIARYSGLVSDYQVIRITNWTTQVKDLRSGSPDGTDTLYDVERLQWGDGSFFNLNNPPQLTTQPLSSFKGQGLSLAQLSSYSDPDNNAVAKYQLLDTTADPNSGYFIVNGVVQAAGTVITITSAQFAYTTFVTGTVGDILQIRAFDGYYWSAPDNGPWSPFTIAITAGPPVVTASNVTVPTNQSLALSSLFSVTSDAPITQYQLWDGNGSPDSGYFVVNGVAQTARTPITITAAQLAQTVFISGTAQADALTVSAFNGYYWSNTGSFQATPSGPLNSRPELTLGTWNPQHTA